MDPLELVRLPPLMAITRGRAELVVGVVDGPVALNHPDLVAGNFRTIRGTGATCRDVASASCRHGTFVAGILAARRGARAPAIAPDCTLLVRPIFLETTAVGELPSATPGKLAEAIVDCVDAGAQILNVSAALAGWPLGRDRELGEAIEYTANRGALMITAAGNQSAVTGSAIISHPWVIPAVAYTSAGRPVAQSNLGRSIGSRGLGGPGESVVSLTPGGESAVSTGTSIAAPFVAGAAALLWSLFPDAGAADVKSALLSPHVGRRRTVIPPLLDAWRAYEMLSASQVRRTGR